MSSNFVFSELKKGDRKQGYPRDPEGVERDVPLLEIPPFSTRKCKINANFDFTTVCRNVTVKQVNIEICLIFRSPVTK